MFSVFSHSNVLGEDLPPPCKHRKRQGHRGRKAPTLPQRKKMTKVDYVRLGKEVFPLYSYKTSYFGPHCQRAGRVPLSKYYRTSRTEPRTQRLSGNSIYSVGNSDVGEGERRLPRGGNLDMISNRYMKS